MKKRPLLGLGLSLALGVAIAPAGLAAPTNPAQTLKTYATVTGPVSEFILKNGLKVILKESHAAPVVTWAVYYKVGSRNEWVGATGSAHLLEHMMFKGTKTLGKGQVARLLSRNGAEFNASTWTDWTRYFETYSSERLELGLKVEAARMEGALIKDSERQSEMTVVRNEMERDETDPGTVLYQAVDAIAYKGQPYHHPVIGWRSDVENVPTSTLKDYYHTFYEPNNAIAVLVGDFKTPEAMALISRYFEGIKAGPTPPKVHTYDEPQLGERRVVLDRRGETNVIELAYHIPAIDDPDIAPLLVLSTVFSSGRTDRLYRALVNKQLATSAWADTGLQVDPSLFRLGATLHPGVSHAEVEKAVLEQIEALKTTAVPAAELQKAKNQSEAATTYEREGTEGLAQDLGSFAAISSWQRSFSLLKQIKAVTPADLQRVARTYLKATNRNVGWYVATKDGPVPPQPTNTGGGKAVANSGKVVSPLLFPFELRSTRPHALTKPIRRVLPNGLTVLLLKNDAAPTIALNGFIRGGHAQDPKGKDGLAALTAAMLDRGTLHHDKFQLAGALETVAAELNFSAGTFTTGISGKSLAKDEGTLVSSLSEILREPAFPVAELEKLKANRIASIQQAQDDPDTRAGLAFNHQVYPMNSPLYELDPKTRIAEIKGVTAADCQAFYHRYYGPNTTTLAVVGNVNPAEVTSRLERSFSGWKAAESVTFQAPKTMAHAPQRVVIPMMDKTNVVILYGHADDVKRASPDYFAAKLASYILGGDTLTGRLGVRLRDEMGLTYGVYAELDAGLFSGPWNINLTVNPANVDTALKAMKQVITTYLGQGASAQELASAKSTFIGSQAVQLATNAGLAASLANIELYGLGLDYWAKYPALIQALSLAQVNQAARRTIRPSQANVVIAGPYRAVP